MLVLRRDFKIKPDKVFLVGKHIGARDPAFISNDSTAGHETYQ